MDMSPPATDAAISRGSGSRPYRLIVLLVMLSPSRPALANLRAPLVVPTGPSTAAFAVDLGFHLVVISEDLNVQCQTTGCTVKAQYRIQAQAPVRVGMSFVMPLAAPLEVTVGSVAAPIRVNAASASVLHEEEVLRAERGDELRPLPKYQVSFTALLVAGENSITATYQQPLGHREHGHGYLSKGRFTDFFRYELWPLSEWRHAPGFHITGQVTIHRPPPSWWKRTFSQPRSVGCEAAERVMPHELRQQGDDLQFIFKIVDPLPRRIWCHVGDQDIVPK